MVSAEQIILAHVVTEKATEATSLLNQYTFKVAKAANRNQIKSAIERHFEVKVVGISVMNTKPKFKRDRYRRGNLGRKPGYKKAIVRLQPGDTIDLA